MSKTKVNPKQPTEPLPEPSGEDENTGKGGAYEIRDGKRVLVERTQPRPEPDGVESL